MEKGFVCAQISVPSAALQKQLLVCKISVPSAAVQKRSSHAAVGFRGNINPPVKFLVVIILVVQKINLVSQE